MGIGLVDLERWDPGSVRAVASAATTRADSYRDKAHNFGQIVSSLEWEGLSGESAIKMAEKISADMQHHADECYQAAGKVSAAASEVESIKSTWQRIQRMADRWGIGIDIASSELIPPTTTTPEQRAEVEHHMQILHDEIVDLLRRANSTDQHLAAAVNGAISDMSENLGTDHIDSPQDAQQTVEQALAGNKDAAAQVKSVLDSITPEQRDGTAPLTPQQASVLSQMQAQQHGMSVDELDSAEQGMGDSKGAMSDSWQLMSNPNVHFPKTDLQPGAIDDPKNITSGGFSQLPTSVQDPLKSKGMSQLGETTKISNIVKDGNVGLRQGTELDRNMLYKTTEMMNASDFTGHVVSAHGQAVVEGSGVQTANDMLATAGGDHQAVHDILGAQEYSDKFMHGALTTNWQDNGKAVSDMFSWTGDAADGPQAKLAAETAHAYGAYVGSHEQELLHMGGNQTLGEVNPLAARGLAYGLAPYIPDMAGIGGPGSHPDFGDIDTSADRQSGALPVAKGLFSVIGTEGDAGKYFNSQAGQDILDAQNQYANDFKNGANVTSDNAHLRDSMTLQGLVAAGNHTATDATEINTDQRNTTAYNNLKDSYGLLAEVADIKLPGTAAAAQALQDSLLGPAPTATWSQHDMADMDVSQPSQQVLNALVRNGVAIHGAPDGLIAPPDADNPQGFVRSLDQYQQWAEANHVSFDDSSYNEAVNAAVAATMDPSGTRGIQSQLQNMVGRYNAVTDDADPQR